MQGHLKKNTENFGQREKLKSNQKKIKHIYFQKSNDKTDKQNRKKESHTRLPRLPGTYEASPQGVNSNNSGCLLNRTEESSRKRNDTFKVVKETNIQPRIFCPVKLSIKSVD